MVILLQVVTIVTVVISVLVLLLMLYAKGKRRVHYRVFVLILNREGEQLLIYDKKEGRLTVPALDLPGNEIPTRFIPKIVDEVIGYRMEHLRVSSLFHPSLRKYDRTRDDHPPAFIAERTFGKEKYYCELYVLEDGGDPQQLPRTLFPYPEFFTYEEIQAMDESAIPNELCLYFIHNVWEVTMGNKERR